MARWPARSDMTQRFVRAAFYRGGTSKGVMLHARDCPTDAAQLDNMLLSILGSPDPFGRQLDGMGGGSSSLSKAAIIGPPTVPGADIDYTFAQVAVSRPVVDWGANCGNLSSAVGPFAVDEGLVRVADGTATVRIHQVNTRKLIHARFAVADGIAVIDGDCAIGGVAGTRAPITLDFLDPGATVTPALLPGGAPLETIDVDGVSYEVSLVDASNPVVFVSAASLGLTGTELPAAIELRGDVMARLDHIRRVAGVRMGLGATPDSVGLANPKIAMIAAPADFTTLSGQVIPAADYDIGIRIVSMDRVHNAVTLTGAMCLAVATCIDGTLAARFASKERRAQSIRVGNPSGIVEVGADVASDVDGWHARSASVLRTARLLMRGEVAVR